MRNPTPYTAIGAVCYDVLSYIEREATVQEARHAEVRAAASGRLSPLSGGPDPAPPACRSNC
jgi:hypothetical protein